MHLFDFSTQVANNSPFPVATNDFSFRVIGALATSVDKRGIHCGHYAVLQMTLSANAIELKLVNGAAGASITASDASGQHTESKNLVSSPATQTIRFDFEGIRLIVFESPNNELFLTSVS